MSTRIAVSSLAGVVVLGGIAAGTVALVGTADAAGAPAAVPTVTKSSATSLVLGTTGTKTFTFKATVADDSGIKNVKVLLWPKSSKLNPTAKDMASVESATCKASSATTSVCTYTLKVDAKKNATDIPSGTWYTAILATAKDHDTVYSAKADTFTIKRQAS